MTKTMKKTLPTSTETKNKYGKVNAKSKKLIDNALIKLINLEQIDLDIVKKESAAIANKLCDARDLASLEYLYMSFEDISQHLSQNLEQSSYTMTNRPTILREVFKSIRMALRRPDTKITAQIRAKVLSADLTLRKMLETIKEAQKISTSNDEMQISLTTVEFGELQHILRIDFLGGLDVAEKIQMFNELLLEPAIEIQNDSKRIQLFELVTDDITAAMNMVSASNLIDARLKEADEMIANGNLEDAKASVISAGMAADKAELPRDIIDTKLSLLKSLIEESESKKAAQESVLIK